MPMLTRLTCFLALAAAVTGPLAAQYDQPYRPQVHFSPAANWMNDPNGLVYFQGEYHLFFQHNPKNNLVGPMHWGHAVSTDLVHWKELPIALFPDSLGRIFSGSVVVDDKNTSGLFAPGTGGLVAVFTHSLNRQQQSLAYSSDKGRTWTKYAGNPVIKNATAKSGLPLDFRDPMVFWLDELGQWLMALAVKDHMEFWTSPDLKTWTKNSDFGQGLGTPGSVWECPVLFSLPAEKSRKWVLLVSINPGSPHGGSATHYFVGDIKIADGKFQFVSDHTDIRWLDGGADNYAAALFAGLGDRRLSLSWMSNWLYAQKVPTAPWRGAMTLPRDLRLVKQGQDWRLASWPAPELKTLEGENLLKGTDPKAGSWTVGPQLAVSHLTVRYAPTKAARYGLELVNASGQSFKVVYDAGQKTLSLDRSAFNTDIEGFAKVHPLVLPAPLDSLQLDLWLDRGSVEVFVNGGLYSLTNIVFPTTPFQTVKLIAEQGTVTVSELQAVALKSIW